MCQRNDSAEEKRKEKGKLSALFTYWNFAWITSQGQYESKFKFHEMFLKKFLNVNRALV